MGAQKEREGKSKGGLKLFSHAARGKCIMLTKHEDLSWIMRLRRI